MRKREWVIYFLRSCLESRPETMSSSSSLNVSFWAPCFSCDSRWCAVNKTDLYYNLHFVKKKYTVSVLYHNELHLHMRRYRCDPQALLLTRSRGKERQTTECMFRVGKARMINRRLWMDKERENVGADLYSSRVQASPVCHWGTNISYDAWPGVWEAVRRRHCELDVRSLQESWKLHGTSTCMSLLM